MIFVTVGTEKYPFNRLLRCVDDAVDAGVIKEEVFAQIGISSYKPQGFGFCDFMRYDQMMKMVSGARIVIAHAGTGTYLTCLQANKIPILFPRSTLFGEHIDNHQVDFSQKMAGAGKAIIANDTDDLIQKISDYDNLAKELNDSREISSKEKMITFLDSIIHQ